MPGAALRPTVRRSLVTGAAVGAVALGLRALSKPLPHDERTLLDWGHVRDIAAGRCGEPPGTLHNAAALGREYDVYAEQLAPLMEPVCQSTPEGFPHFTVLDRRGFIDSNLRIAQRLFEPVESLRAQVHESRATAAGRTVMSRYLGEMFGFVSKRVLGQYDPVLMLSEPLIGESPSLYLVESNVRSFEQTSGVSGEALRRYLILHELTHAWQFERHAWLRTYLGDLMRELMMTGLLAQFEKGAGAHPASGALVTAVPRQVRAQMRALHRIQAVMSVLEGYGNFVMHRVGREHLPHFDELEHAFHLRKVRRSAFERVVLAVTGLSMKMRQYELGEQFSDAVTERGGPALLNRVWERQESMPTMDELRNPARWMARVG